MYKADKAMLLALGSAMLVSAGVATAVPPTPFTYGTSYTLNPATGVLTLTCPTGATCGTPITGTGFAQRSVVIGSTTYYQTIIDQPGTGTDSFIDESFVQQGGGTGVADQQTLSQAGTTGNPGNFNSTSTISAGWAQGPNESAINLSQTIQDPNSGFLSGFQLQGNGTVPTSLRVNQSVCLDAADTACANSASDHQIFDLRQTVASSNGSTVTGTFFPTSISWTGSSTTGDIIQAIWLGQTVTTTPATSTTSAVQQAFGYESFTDVTTNATVSYSDQTTPGPFDYQTTAPIFSGPLFNNAPPTF